MKKIIIILTVLFFAITGGLMAQFAKVNPIPSYNYQMTTGQSAGFQEPGKNNDTREKRDMQIEVTTSSDAMTRIFATVLIVKKNGTQTLGPFIVYNNETLSVSLPKGKWGAVINSNWNVNISIWIGKGNQRTLNEILEND